MIALRHGSQQNKNVPIPTEVLDVAGKSFAYNGANNGYFVVRNLRRVENLTLEQLLEEKGIGHPPNVIVS